MGPAPGNQTAPRGGAGQGNGQIAVSRQKERSGMKALLGATIATVFAAATTATAEITLQMDINGFQVQAKNNDGSNSGFGGLHHTGSIDFNTGPFAVLNSVSIRHGNSPPVDQGFIGSLVT